MRSWRWLRVAAVGGIVVSMGVLAAACNAGATAPAPAGVAGCAAPGPVVAAPGASAKARSLSPGDHEVTLTVQTFRRCFILFVPPKPAVKNRPLILVYHGALDTAQGTEAETDFQQVASQTGEVVAFLQGVDGTWNDGAGATPAEKLHVNDVAFTLRAIEAIGKLTPFDHKRIVAAGFSNGALLVQYLGCKIANQLAMIVPVEGELPVNVSRTCSPSRGVSVYEVHGTNDSAIPYWGGTFVGVGGAVITVLSAPASVARWAAMDKCSATPLVTYPSRSIQLAIFGYCKRLRLVTLRSIIGGVHQWTPDIGQLVADSVPAN